MHLAVYLADAFIQSDLQCIQAIHLFIMCVPWESNPPPFALQTQFCTTEPQEHFNVSWLNKSINFLNLTNHRLLNDTVYFSAL